MYKEKGKVESKMTDLSPGRIIFALVRTENLEEQCFDGKMKGHQFPRRGGKLTKSSFLVVAAMSLSDASFLIGYRHLYQHSLVCLKHTDLSEDSGYDN